MCNYCSIHVWVYNTIYIHSSYVRLYIKHQEQNFLRNSEASQCTWASPFQRAKRITRADGGKSPGYFGKSGEQSPKPWLFASYMGIVISHYKNPYQPISIMECQQGLVHVAQMFVLFCHGKDVAQSVQTYGGPVGLLKVPRNEWCANMLSFHHSPETSICLPNSLFFEVVTQQT